MKKLGLLIAILVLSFSVVAGSAVMAVDYGDNDIPYSYFQPKQEIEVDDATYVSGIDDNTAVVVGVTVEDGAAVIPATVVINDVECAVTAIANDAFVGSTATEIRLPNTINVSVNLDLTGFNGYVFVQPFTTTSTAIPVTGTPEKASGIYYKGDYNADNETAVGDVIEVLKDIAGGVEITGYAALACDVVDNGSVDVSDSIRLLQWLASKETITLD